MRSSVAADSDHDASSSFFEIPNWAVRLVVILLVFGLPIALVFAWIFELTPDGYFKL